MLYGTCSSERIFVFHLCGFVWSLAVPQSLTADFCVVQLLAARLERAPFGVCSPRRVAIPIAVSSLVRSISQLGCSVCSRTSGPTVSRRLAQSAVFCLYWFVLDHIRRSCGVAPVGVPSRPGSRFSGPVCERFVDGTPVQARPCH